MTISLALLAGSLTMTPNALPVPKAQPFALSEIRLTGGPFAHATKVCTDYLLEVNPDRLLHSFRKHSGLEPKGAQYGGWENSGLAGHTLGHYLTACAQHYAATGDVRYKQKVDHIVDELVECQKNRPDGYISAIPDGDKKWAEIRKGDIRSGGFDLNGMWSPWYTHHKVFAGLLDAQALAGNQKALGVAEKFADWAIWETEPLNDEQWEKMLGCEYGGMNESLAELYNRTKKEKYLTLARKFYDHRVLDPLAEEKDSLPGKHSNTQIPKIIGLARLYEITGNERDRKTAEFFWSQVVNHHTYAMGGNSNHEYLGPPDKLSDRLSTNTAETCNTYNMLKLSRHLFAWEPRANVADYYERAYLNHILASQNPKDGMMTYFVPLASGSHRRYSNKWFDFTCCHGSGMENHTKHADSAYFHHGKDKLWVNLFMPTELNWKEAGVKLKQETNFPFDPKVTLTVDEAKGGEFEMNIRHPYWATTPIDIKVNGKVAAKSATPSSFTALKRKWKKGDKVEFTLPMTLRTQPMPDNENRVALMYGPVVLAADLGPEDKAAPRIPVLVDDNKPLTAWIEPVAGQPLTFRTKGAGRPNELTLKPFYGIYDDRYAVYFDRFDDAGWHRLEAEYRAEEQRVKELEARTLDYVRIGEMQPERDHKLKSERNDVRESNGRSFRTPLGNGWFEFEMKVDGEKPNDLVMTYWGSDRSNPTFDILIDGQKLLTETLPERKPNVFFDASRPIPEEMTKGKRTVIVRIQAVEGKAASAVAGARTVRRP